MTLTLVSCVSQKRAERSRARDLYVSEWFKKARRYAERHSNRWVILSAEFGVLDPDAEIAPYERTLNTMPIADRREWARRVLEQLTPILVGVQKVVVLAGDRYRELLMPKLRELCPVVEVPLQGLRIGEQLHWFAEREDE